MAQSDGTLAQSITALNLQADSLRIAIDRNRSDCDCQKQFRFHQWGMMETRSELRVYHLKWQTFL
jgi:hypothetical protein